MKQRQKNTRQEKRESSRVTFYSPTMPSCGLTRGKKKKKKKKEQFALNSSRAPEL